MSLPGVTEAAEVGDWDRARQELARLQWSFEAMAESCASALEAIEP